MYSLERYDNAYGTNYGFGIVDPQKPDTPSVSQRTFTWNERNLLKTSKDARFSVQYRYGSDGQRAIKASTRSENLYYNSMWQVRNSFDGAMLQSKHIFVGEARLVTKCNKRGEDNLSFESVNTYYYHADHLGSVQLVTNSLGNIHERIEYTPYGETWIEKKDGLVTPFRFTGKELDEETGLYYYGARYLDPKYSRWLSADPALGDYIPGAPINDEARKRNKNLPGMGGVFNTVNLHLYHYAGNNLVKYLDPDGRAVVGLVIKAIIIIDLASGFQISGATKDFIKQYKIMRDENVIGNDHFNHAMANSKATSRGPLGKLTAQALSFAREATDVALKGDTKRDVREDNIANRHGRDIKEGESPSEHNSQFDTRQGGNRASLPEVENKPPKNVVEFFKTFFTRDKPNEN